MDLPTPEDAYLRAQRDPVFRERFVRAYDGSGDALAVLERVATHAREDRLVAAALYGPHPAAEVDPAAAAALERDRIDRGRVAAALARAAAPASAPAPQAVPRVARPSSEAAPAIAAPRGSLRGRRVPLLAVLAAAAALLPLAYLAGSSSTRSSAAARPELPATLLLDDQGGVEGRVAYFAPSDQRGGDAVLPPVRGGYVVTTACLASSRRPRVVPAEGVLLVDTTGVQIGRWASPCDGRERAFPVQPPPGTTQHAQLLLDLDGRQVKAAWAAVRPKD